MLFNIYIFIHEVIGIIQIYITIVTPEYNLPSTTFRQLSSSKMGNIYSKKEYMYWYIEKSDKDKVRELAKTNPDLLNAILTNDSQVTAFTRSAWRGDSEMVDLLLELGADINVPNGRGETAAFITARRGKIDLLKHLVQKGATLEGQTHSGLTIMDQAVLAGNYDVAWYLIQTSTSPRPKSPDFYQQKSSKTFFRYVNYQKFIESLNKGTNPENIDEEALYVRPKKVYSDPVIDPRESWKDWFKRTLNFGEPPLVERSSLPFELQPQNRKMGKLHHYLNMLTSSSTIQPNLYPVRSQVIAPAPTQNELRRPRSQSQLDREV